MLSWDIQNLKANSNIASYALFGSLIVPKSFRALAIKIFKDINIDHNDIILLDPKVSSYTKRHMPFIEEKPSIVTLIEETKPYYMIQEILIERIPSITTKTALEHYYTNFGISNELLYALPNDENLKYLSQNDIIINNNRLEIIISKFKDKCIPFILLSQASAFGGICRIDGLSIEDDLKVILHQFDAFKLNMKEVHYITQRMYKVFLKDFTKKSRKEMTVNPSMYSNYYLSLCNFFDGNQLNNWHRIMFNKLIQGKTYSANTYVKTVLPYGGKHLTKYNDMPTIPKDVVEYIPN